MDMSESEDLKNDISTLPRMPSPGKVDTCTAPPRTPGAENTWPALTAPPVCDDEAREEFAIDDEAPTSISATSALPLLLLARARTSARERSQPTTSTFIAHHDAVSLYPIGVPEVPLPAATAQAQFVRPIHTESALPLGSASAPARLAGRQARPIAPKPNRITEAQRKSAISFLVGPTDAERREQKQERRKIAKRETAMRINARRAAKRKAARAAAAAAATASNKTSTIDNGG